MSDPKRWLDDPNAPSAASGLLAALRAPEPLSSATEESIKHRLAATLVNAPAATATALAKWKLLAAAGAIIAGGALVAYFTMTGSKAPAEPPVPREMPVVASPPAVAPAPAPEPDVAPARPKPIDEPAKPPVSAAHPQTRADSLALEEALLEQARQASTSSPARALSLLREHERRFPNGELTSERLFLTAKALAESGNQKAARRYARELEKRFPASTYVPRLHALLPGPFEPDAH